MHFPPKYPRNKVIVCILQLYFTSICLSSGDLLNLRSRLVSCTIVLSGNTTSSGSFRAGMKLEPEVTPLCQLCHHLLLLVSQHLHLGLQLYQQRDYFSTCQQ